MPTLVWELYCGRILDKMSNVKCARVNLQNIVMVSGLETALG